MKGQRERKKKANEKKGNGSGFCPQIEYAKMAGDKVRG
jgi:hypothetical protein